MAPEASPAETARAAKITRAFAELSSGKRRHLPVIQPRDAVILAAQYHRVVDTAVAQREREVVADGGAVACAAGCSACCNTAVMVYEPEARRVAELLAEPAQAEARAHFLARYPAWQAELGKDVERIRTLHRLGRFDDAERLFFRLQARRVMCALNRDGLCTVYEARPTICRNTHALDTAAHCQPDAERKPTVAGSATVDVLMSQLEGVMGPLQDALRRQDGGPPDALCAQVYELLQAPPAEVAPPARNAPCPCGSGAKLKHCCDF